MKVILDGGRTIDLGETEATPTVGMTDFSRRETDDFGVTTVVERGFARRMGARLIVPFDQADELQRTFADLRATPAQWVADERFAWLNFRGFYKDFEIDLAVPPVSYCTLVVEGLAETELVADAGEDPAPLGSTSTLQLLQPAPISGAALVSSSVPENDHPEWSAAATYALGQRVIKSATHRIYESATAGNKGNDPAGVSGLWIDVGPTNRWAMFDEALGSVTSAASSITVSLSAGQVEAVALLDVKGTAVRVQTTGYDRTLAPNPAGTVTFLDLPGAANPVTVTITGSGVVEVGTLLLGRLVGLGSTIESPKAGIADFSRKEADEFGDVQVVERAWAKRMSVQAMIRADALDVVANRIASVRAKPSLWIGKEGIETLTAYGFFKDFSIEVGETVSKLSLSVEGLSKAPKLLPLPAEYSDGTPIDDLRPAQAGADVTGDNTSANTEKVGDKTADEVAGTVDEVNDPELGLQKARQRIAEVQGEVENLTGIYGDTLSAAQSAAAAAASRDAAQEAEANASAAKVLAEQALSDASAARIAAEQAEADALIHAQAASGSADAAAGYASAASSYASDAEGRATAAAADALLAQTKAAEALASSGSAAASASDAAGSASSASSSATVAAAARDATVQAQRRIFASDFNNGGGYWVAGYEQSKADLPTAPSVADYSGISLVPVAGIGTVLQSDGVYRVFSERETRPFIEGQKVRLRVRTRLTQNPSSGSHVQYVWIVGVNADGSFAGDVSITAWFGLTAADGWVTREITFDPLALRNIGPGGISTAAEWRLMPGINGYNPDVAGAVQQIQWITLEDVTALDQAEDAASAAASSEASAAASVTAAGQQASAAQAASTDAQTASGQAQAYASNAAASATNAEGSSNNAASYAGVAASSAVSALMVENNQHFDAGTAGWASSIENADARIATTDMTAMPSYSGATNVLAFGVRADMWSFKKFPVVAGRKYRLKARFGISVAYGTVRQYMGIQTYDASGPIGINDGYMYFLVQGNTYGPGWQEVEGTFQTSDLPAGTTSVRLIAWNNYDMNALANGVLDYFTIEDITSEAAAAQAASAASVSASAASASENAAGQSAAASNQSKVDAQTALGHAQVAAVNAATSESNATEAANTAAASASLSAASAGASGRSLAASFPRAISPEAFTEVPSVFPDAPALKASDISTTGAIIRSSASSSYPWGVWTRAVAPYVIGKTYRLSAKVTWVAGWPDQPVAVFYATFFDKDGFAFTEYTISNAHLVPTGSEASITTDFLCAGPSPAVFVRFGLLTQRAPGTLDILNGSTHVSAFYVDDVSSEKAASGSASAAASSAAVASTKADESGQSAAAANTSKLAAEAANGSAQSAASIASANAATASSEASAALASQRLAAAYSATQGVTPNGLFDKGETGWSVVNGTYSTSWDGGPGYRFAPGVHGSITSTEYQRVDTSHTYRLHCKLVNHGNASVVYIGLACYDINKVYLGNAYIPGDEVPRPVPGGAFYNFEADYTGEAGGAPPIFALQRQFAVGTVYVVPFAYLNYPEPTPANATIDINALYLKDITETAAVQSSVNQQATAIATVQGSMASLQTTVAAQGVKVTDHATAIAELDGIVAGQRTIAVDAGGRWTGIEINGTPQAGGVDVVADRFRIWGTGLTSAQAPFEVDASAGLVRLKKVAIGDATIDRAKIADLEVVTGKLAYSAASKAYLLTGAGEINFASQGVLYSILSLNIQKDDPDSVLEILAQFELFGSDAVNVDIVCNVSGNMKQVRWHMDANGNTNLPSSYSFFYEGLPAGSHGVIVYGRRFDQNNAKVVGERQMRIREFKR